MIDRSHIGATSETRIVKVEEGFLKFFAKATRERNPVYFDEAAAQAAGHRAIPAPPTYLFSLNLAAPRVRGNMFDDLGVDKGRVLHGEQSFTYENQIYAGDTISLVSKTVDIYDKKGGALEFIVEETSATNQLGQSCGKMRSVTVVRNG